MQDPPLLRFRPMKRDDLERVLDIERENFGDRAWSLKTFEYELEKSFARYFVLEKLEGKSYRIIGYIGGWHIIDELHITNVCIAKRYQGRGYGKFMLGTFLKLLKSERPELKIAVLEVEATNYRAISLYEKFGFKKVSLRKDYYGKDKHAYQMLLNFNGKLSR